jgi:AcrR family transcriptional regulator
MVDTQNVDLTERQQEVLDAALALLKERGEAPTMNAVAERASCSKETLYKWFGGREGLLTATVQRQASRVRGLPVPSEGLDREVLEASLVQFARNWLTTITGETSVALNRLAVGEAGAEGRPLGRIVLENGPFAMRRRLEPLLEGGREAGLLAFDSTEEAFRTFFGLVVRDTQMRLLLGEAQRPSAKAIDDHAVQATAQFFALFGADHRGADGRRRNT